MAVPPPKVNFWEWLVQIIYRLNGLLILILKNKWKPSNQQSTSKKLNSFSKQHEPSVYIDIAVVWLQLYGMFEIVVGFLEHFQINQSLTKTASKLTP